MNPVCVCDRLKQVGQIDRNYDSMPEQETAVARSSHPKIHDNTTMF